MTKNDRKFSTILFSVQNQGDASVPVWKSPILEGCSISHQNQTTSLSFPIGQKHSPLPNCASCQIQWHCAVKEQKMIMTLLARWNVKGCHAGFQHLSTHHHWSLQHPCCCHHCHCCHHSCRHCCFGPRIMGTSNLPPFESMRMLSPFAAMMRHRTFPHQLQTFLKTVVEQSISHTFWLCKLCLFCSVWFINRWLNDHPHFKVKDICFR